MKFLPIFLSLSLASVALAQEPAELTELRQTWETQRSEAQGKVDKLYFEELEQLKKNFTQASNITDALAVDNVIKGGDKADNEPQALTKVRLARDKSLKKVSKPLDKRYWQDLLLLKDEYVKAGDLAGVVAADAEIEKVLVAYEKPEPPKKRAEVAKKKAQKNLTPNPSFEKMKGDNPESWQTKIYQTGIVRFSTENEAHSGKRCIAISTETGVDAGWIAVVPVKPNTTYNLSGWIKTQNVKGAMGASLGIEGRKETYVSLTGTNKWKHVTSTVLTGNETQLLINCLLGGWGVSTGKAWFDDISLIEQQP